MTRVLVVDDEPIVARAVTIQLRMMRIESVAVHNGDDGAALDGGAFDLVISDVDMEPMNGLALLDAMEARGLNVPLAFLTGLPRAEIVTQARASSLVRAVLQKPLVGTAFFEAIRSMLELSP